MLLASNTPALTALLIVLAGSGGLIGSIIGMVKLRGDTNQSAVIQAQGAMETMQSLNESLKAALERSNQRGDFYKAKWEAAEDEIAKLHGRWGPFAIEDEL